MSRSVACSGPISVGVVHRVHVSVGEVVVGGIEPATRPLVALQRVDIREQHAAEAVFLMSWSTEFCLRSDPLPRAPDG
jgi:hypothetical protein